jgi:hypothetical protein
MSPMRNANARCTDRPLCTAVLVALALCVLPGGPAAAAQKAQKRFVCNRTFDQCFAACQKQGGVTGFGQHTGINAGCARWCQASPCTIGVGR